MRKVAPAPLTVKKHPVLPSDQGTDAADEARGKWLKFSNLKFETTIFLLIVLTFAALLGQEAITRQEVELAGQSTQYYAFTYGDQDSGGATSVSHDPARPLNWSCHLRPGTEHAFCGYGLQLDSSDKQSGIDYSKYSDIRLQLTYHGVGDNMRLLVQTAIPPALRPYVKNGGSLPMVAEFPVEQGDNIIHIKKSQFMVEEWWLLEHNIARDDVPISFDNILSVALSSGNQTPHGRFDVSVKNFTFKGASISSAHWYLLILSLWLVATGAFLVFRFFNMRRAYEARQRRQTAAAEALARAHAAAEASSAAKSQFLANMSHELRTPLNAILGYTQLLRNDQLTDKQRAAINTIHHSGEHLLAMITDILDIAKVEAGRLEIIPARFDLHDCVLNVTQMIRLRAEEKGLRLSTVIHDDVPQYVIADQKRVRQILINLLGNAVKFTLEGEITITVSVLSADTTQARLCFEVADSGIGIPEDQLTQIFRPFEQAGNAIDRSGGTGLGLSITRQIVEIMGGGVTVESRLGQGSRFRVEARFDLGPEAAGHSLTSATPQPETPVSDAGDAPVTAPDAEQMARLLVLARTGNLRAIRNEIPSILSQGDQYRPFATRLDDLAASYQSPAVLRFIEQYVQERTA